MVNEREKIKEKIEVGKEKGGREKRERGKKNWKGFSNGTERRTEEEVEKRVRE